MNVIGLIMTLENTIEVFHMVERFVQGEARVKALHAAVLRLENIIKELKSEDCEH